MPFICHDSYIDSIEYLPDEFKGEISYAVLVYGSKGIIPEGLSPVSMALLTSFIPTIDSAKDAYNRRVENGKKGGRKKTETEPEENQNETEQEPNENRTGTETEPKQNLNETESEPKSNQSRTETKQDKDKDKDKDKDIIIPLGGSLTDGDSVMLDFPLRDGTNYSVTESFVKELKNLYPEIDVESELRQMYGWLDGNPQKRKTKTGIKKFIHSWLSREIDSQKERGQPVAKLSEQDKKDYIQKQQNDSYYLNQFGGDFEQIFNQLHG